MGKVKYGSHLINVVKFFLFFVFKELLQRKEVLLIDYVWCKKAYGPCISYKKAKGLYIDSYCDKSNYKFRRLLW